MESERATLINKERTTSLAPKVPLNDKSVPQCDFFNARKLNFPTLLYHNLPAIFVSWVTVPIVHFGKYKKLQNRTAKIEL